MRRRSRGAVLLALLALVGAPAPARAVPDDRLAVAHGRLVRDGHAVVLTGVDAFGATTWWGTNWGCGSPVTDLDAMFASLRPGSLVRTWAFQALGWNNKVTPQRQDFTALDRVVAAAERHHELLDLVLSDQAGTCDDGHWHDQAWYDGAYRARHPDDGRGLGDRSYSDWLTAVLTRYRHSPAVAVWEPVNEPEASSCTGATGDGCRDPARRSCPPGATASLRHFFDAVGARVHALDPGSLVGSGALGGGECGMAGDGWATVAASPGIDVLSYHDQGDASAFPGGLAQRLDQARAVGKPLLVGEVGIVGGPACPSGRTQLAADKLGAAVAHGAQGWLAWWYVEQPSSCGADLGPADPELALLR